MKTSINIFFFFVILLLGACKSETKDKIQDGRMCFASSEKGITSVIALEIEGKEVLGTYIIESIGKDKTEGDFFGNLKDNVIKATFDYWIEGQNQMEEIELTLLKDKIQIKRPGQVEINGEMFDRDSGKETTTEITKTNCNDVSKEMD
ncbi:MAG: hypothetical protein CVU03_06865 [Bacteroidetes bacterium HGW-Bacteroidetes-2]|jgi:hypothetical protein|nr:MAG: hypothetical protein CVU03_06865 [Bacteroidetes bacterium HGW-Bacteroidetes-2]